MGKKHINKLKINLDNDKSEVLFELSKGRNEAYKYIIDKYGDKVYSIAYCITRSHTESEEVFQEVFLTIFKKITSLKDYKSLSSWIKTITVNFARKKIRDRQRDLDLLDRVETVASLQMLQNDQFSESENTMNKLLLSEAETVLNKAISELPPKYKCVIVLNDLNNFSLQKTSAILNISIPAVKSRLRRARQKLKKELDIYFI